MLPVLALTCPSSGVPTKRLSSEPGWAEWGSAAREGGLLGWRRMKARSCTNARGAMRLPAANPEPSSRLKAVESIFTESIRKRRSTSNPAAQDPAPRNSRPRILSSISANQFWLEFRIGKIMSPRGRPRYSASGGGGGGEGADEQQRTAR